MVRMSSIPISFVNARTVNRWHHYQKGTPNTMKGQIYVHTLAVSGAVRSPQARRTRVRLWRRLSG